MRPLRNCLGHLMEAGVELVLFTRTLYLSPTQGISPRAMQSSKKRWLWNTGLEEGAMKKWNFNRCMRAVGEILFSVFAAQLMIFCYCVYL